MSSDFSRRTLMKGICSTAALSAALPAAAVLPAAAADGTEYKGPHGPGMPQEGPNTPKICAPTRCPRDYRRVHAASQADWRQQCVDGRSEDALGRGGPAGRSRQAQDRRPGGGQHDDRRLQQLYLRTSRSGARQGDRRLQEFGSRCGQGRFARSRVQLVRASGDRGLLPGRRPRRRRIYGIQHQ